MATKHDNSSTTARGRRHATVCAAALFVLSSLLAGCGAAGTAARPSLPAQVGKPADIPAVTQASLASSDTSTWQRSRATAEGLTFSYRYPAGWNADLSYCSPAAKVEAHSVGGFHLPAGCVSTDILVGQKAEDVGHIEGTPLNVGGRRAVRRLETPPEKDVASAVYTVMLYGDGGAPLFGFASYIGPETAPGERARIVGLLDGVASTVVLEKGAP